MNSSIIKTILALIISTFCTELSAKVAPDYINICAGLKSDCLKENVQKTIPHFVKGIPSLGLISTDPMQLDYEKFDLAGGLTIEFFNGTITGLRKCIVDSVKYENYESDMNIHCDIFIKGKYKATGKVLLFSLDGEGDAKIKAKNVIIESKIFYEDKVRDGVEYHEVMKIKQSYRFGDRVTFLFTNLFKGNPELSKTILDFLNENWEQVVNEFGKPIIDSMLHLGRDVVKRFFKSIPKNELVAN